MRQKKADDSLIFLARPYMRPCTILILFVFKDSIFFSTFAVLQLFSSYLFQYFFQIVFHFVHVSVFQERNMSLQREREALREALERMQDELLDSETRCEMYRSQLQAMKQLLDHKTQH